MLHDPTTDRRLVSGRLESTNWGYTALGVSRASGQAEALYGAGEPSELQCEERAMMQRASVELQVADRLEGPLPVYELTSGTSWLRSTSATR